MFTPLCADTQSTSPFATPQPSARSRLRRSRALDFTLSCFVAMTAWGTSWWRSQSSS